MNEHLFDGPSRLLWLASYPSSGNTMLRTIMFHCFGLKSASVYRKDLGRRPALEAIVGHIERKPDRIEFGDMPVWLLKTHGCRPDNAAPAIYLIRNGKHATASLFDFEPDFSRVEIIEGRSLPYGNWADHLRGWNPRVRDRTLLLRYEDMVIDLPGIIDRIAEFVGIAPRQRTIPDRDVIAAVDGRWVRPETAPRAELSGELLDRFWEINGEMMRAFGYE